jgi:hypothetical protein
MWGWLFCGKGDPVQIMHVGHGCAPARFDDVNVRSPLVSAAFATTRSRASTTRSPPGGRPGRTHVEAVFRGQDAALLRIGDGRITQAQTIVEARVVVRAVTGGAEAFASTTDLTAEGLSACARTAAERAAALPRPAEPVSSCPRPARRRPPS